MCNCSVLNQKLANKNAKIYLLDKSDEISAQNVRISIDSISYPDPNSNTRMHVATSDVNKIWINNHARGAGDGFLVGLVAGGLLYFGSLVMSTGWYTSRETVAIGPWVSGGALLLSTMIGAGTGSQDVYIIGEKNEKEESWWRRNK